MPRITCNVLITSGLSALLIGGLTSCAPSARVDSPLETPVALAPASPLGDPEFVPGPSRLGLIDVTTDNVAVPGTTPAQVIDTRTFPDQPQDPFPGEPRLVRDHLPPHTKPAQRGPGEPNGLDAEPTLPDGRTNPGPAFPAISSTGWNPPDPTLAVGPNHVVVTVNSRVAFYTKAGVQTFAAPLDSSGNPGFFESLGAGNFCFDPKCFFDHYAQRFVIVVLETYGTTESWVDIAVSDDSDPNGIWYKYRTDAVMTIGSNTAWWDFPGFGYDQNAYYVTGNLFGLNPASGYYGAGIRVFDKSTMLSGAAAGYQTLRLSSGYVIQPAIHFGTPTRAYMATLANSTTLTLYAVNDPLTSPTVSTINIATPSYSGAISAPTLNGSDVSNAGMTMPMWRNGKLYIVHNSQVGGRNVARWHEIDTASWPVSGTPTRTQTGNIDAGGINWTLFPAIGANAAGEVGVILGQSAPNTRVGVSIAGRKPTDPVGRMGAPQLIKPGDSDGGGRWGDYYGVAVDPSDDTTFWGVGQYRNTSSWQTWVGSFTVGAMSPCNAIADHAGTVFIPATPIFVDVLVNDFHSANLPMTIQSFTPTSTRGGTITRSIGTGPGGRDRLTFDSPTNFSGIDSWSYTIADAAGNTSTATVTAYVLNPSSFRAPVNPVLTAAGVNVNYFALSSAPSTMPNFAALAPYLTTTVNDINFASSSNAFANSTRVDDVGAVFEGYYTASADNLYTFSIESDDGSKLYVGDTLFINNDGTHGMREYFADIGLKAGRHKIKIEFFEGGGGAGLIARVRPLGGSKVVIPAASWTRQLPCPADINGGGLTVSDIFDFLNLWFVRDPRADFDGGAITTSDVFAFLNAWFTGC